MPDGSADNLKATPYDLPAYRRAPFFDFPLITVNSKESGCALGDSLEHPLQIERRPADDLEHVGGRSLLLERLAEIVAKVATSAICLSVISTGVRRNLFLWPFLASLIGVRSGRV